MEDNNVLEVRIDNIQDNVLRLENNYRDDIDKLEQEQKEILCMVDDKLKDYKESIGTTIEKLKLDIQTLFNDNQKLRESIIEIKNVVERSSDKTTLIINQLSQQLAQLSQQLSQMASTAVTNKRDFKNQLLYPLLVYLVVGITGFMIGTYIK